MRNTIHSGILCQTVRKISWLSMMSRSHCRGTASERKKFLMCGDLIHTYKKTDTGSNTDVWGSNTDLRFMFLLFFLWFGLLTPLITGIRSQGLDRMVCTVNQSSCITPTARLWLRYRERLMLPEEKFLLHGMILKDGVDLGNSTTSTLNKLAGNSWSYHNFVVGFVSALCTVPVQWLQ